MFSAAPSKSISGVITWTRALRYDITTKRIVLMCWYLCSASSTVYPAKGCTRCRSEHLSASSVAVTFDRQEPFPYGPTHGLALEFNLRLYLFCNFAHTALQWQQAPGSYQQEADRVSEAAAEPAPVSDRYDTLEKHDLGKSMQNLAFLNEILVCARVASQISEAFDHWELRTLH